MKTRVRIKKNDIKKEEITKFIVQILVVAVAGLVGGCAFQNFFESADIIPTGLSGFSLIIHNLLASAGVNIATSIIYLVINSILFLFALKVFGWKFLLLSAVGISFYTLSMQFGAIPGIADVESPDRLLYAIVGGMIMGLTIGLALRFGGSTGGSDISGAILNKYFPKIKTGYCLLAINGVVIILSFITTGDLYIGLYAIIMTIISSLATNLVLDDSKRVVSFYIICDKDKEIAEAILSTFHRGVTKLDAQGMFSGKDKTMLLSLIPKGQAHEMKKLIRGIDENAFVFSSTVTETLGDGDFIKEMSIFKHKIISAKNIVKNNKKYIYKGKLIKQKIFKRKNKFKLFIKNTKNTDNDNKKEEN